MAKYIISYSWQAGREIGTGDIEYTALKPISDFDDIQRIKELISNGDVFEDKSPRIIIVNIIPLPIPFTNE